MSAVRAFVESRRRPPVSVGLVIPSRRGPAWLADVISAIAEAEDAVVTDVVVSNSAATLGAPLVGRTLLRAYGSIDGRIFGRRDDPTHMVDACPAAEEVIGSRPSSGDIAADPEIVIRLDGEPRPLDRWPAPRFGTWALAHGMGLPPTCRPERLGLTPMCPEMLLGRNLTISQLVATVDGERRVLGQAVSRVDRVSLRRGTRGHLRKLPGLVSRTVSAVRLDGVLPEVVADPLGGVPTLDRMTLGSVQIAAGLAKVPVGYVRRLIRRKVAPERWIVAISRQQSDCRHVAFQTLQYLDPPDGREWADPFPVHAPDAELVFVEEYVRAAHRGRLAVVELDDSPRGWRSVETILDLPTHLSYPFVFQWAGVWYLLPEQAATHSLQLYVAEAFPSTWRWHSTALDVPVSDATIAEIAGRWWLFGAVAGIGGTAADELHLFHAATPLGPWTPHARNPVVSDVRSARPAGRVYHRDGTWYRVAQNGAISYGHSITIARIDRIDLDGYRETVVDEIRPDWAPGLIATHTLNSDDGLTAMDVLRIEPRVPYWFRS